MDVVNITDDMIGQLNVQVLTTKFGDKTIPLYIIDSKLLDTYRDQIAFEPLSNLGFSGTDGDLFLIRVDNLPAFKSARLDQYYQGIRHKVLRIFQADK